MITPAQGTDGIRDLAVKNGRIVPVAPDSPGVRIKTDTRPRPARPLRAGPVDRSQPPLLPEQVPGAA